MGIYVIRVPDIGEGIAEVELVSWHVQVGDSITEDQHLADVMTDKATVEVPSPVAGRVLQLGGAVGQILAVGAELVRLQDAGHINVESGFGAWPLGLALLQSLLGEAGWRHGVQVDEYAKTIAA